MSISVRPSGRQDQRVLAVHQVAAVEACRDVHGQRARAQRIEGPRRIGRGHREVAAQADEHLDVAIEHRLDRLDDVIAVLARRLEAEHLAEAVEECGGGAFPRCPSCGRPARSSGRAPGTGPRHAGPILPRIIMRFDNIWIVATRAAVLGQSHAPRHDDALALDVDLRKPFDLLARHARFLDERRPVLGAQVGSECVEAVVCSSMNAVSRMRAVPLATASSSRSSTYLGDCLDQRKVAAECRTHEGPRRSACWPSSAFRSDAKAREAFEPALAQRIDRDDRRAALGNFTQLAEACADGWSRGFWPKMISVSQCSKSSRQ